MLRLLPRLSFLVGLVWIGAILFHDAQVANSQEDVEATRVVTLFAGVVLVGVTAGIVFVVTLLPAIGDWIGNFFFQPGGGAERDAHASALAALAQGDYAKAVEEYEQVVRDDPADVLAYSEIARISCEHCDDPATAARALEAALQLQWPPDDAAFLSNRLVDVYWRYQQNAARATTMLRHLIETMPGTNHATNAQRRIEEIAQQKTLEE